MTTDSQPLTPAFTIAELAAKLNCSTRTLYRLIDDGQLRAYRLGRDYRIDPGEVARFTAVPVFETGQWMALESEVIP